MKRMNILFSTTRQWNPGDEFILRGIINIFKSLEVRFNPVIFNRNPEIKHRETDRCFSFQFDIGRLRFKRLKPGFYDNSFKEELATENFIDLVVFAGTSEWGSARMKVIYEYIDRYSIPAIYLGIGLGSADFSAGDLNRTYKEVMQNAKLITVRDRETEKALSLFGVVYQSCPAFLSAPESMERRISAVKKIGLIYGSDKSVKANKVSRQTHEFMLELYKKIISSYAKQFEFKFICHYINELPEFFKDFPGSDSYYSYDSLDYLDIYNQCDFVIGPRVHGIGISASMGIPGINIRHDVRADTCFGFGAEIIGIDNDLEHAVQVFGSRLKEIKVLNQKLLEEKHRVLESYKQLLKPVFAEIQK